MKTTSGNKLEITRRDMMKGGIGAASLAAIGAGAAGTAAVTAASLAASTGPALAQQALGPGAPTLPVTGVAMHPGYARTIAQMAYVWGWPIVNMLNRKARITQAPSPGLLGGILPVAPRGQVGMLHDYIEPSETFVTCPNQDVVYGLGFFELDDEPVVAQVPDFGDRFWVYALYDARTDQFGHLGKPYGTKPGFYLLVGPDWDGLKPAGITDIIRSPTSLANAIPRIFQADTREDNKDLQPFINQVVFYPLKDFTGQMKTIEWAKLADIRAPPADDAASEGETKWVVPEKFFEQFPDAIAAVDPLPGEEALFAQFRLLIDATERDEELKRMLVDTAIETEEKVIAPFFDWQRNGLPAGNGWNRSVNNAQWGMDYFNRTGTAKSNMFDNRPSETQYFYTDFDRAGDQLTGVKLYEITFAPGQDPPVNGFWSLTLYNDKHLFHPNEHERYSLGTKSRQMKRNKDGSLTIYVSAERPGGDKDSNWLPAPPGIFSLYIRAYWGKEGILDGTWQPPQITVAA
ncbi:DUF1254 domain-containing protein [Ensifer adhaerens]|uniref:DUF1254 domain-containing protein n=1 Tax=Ensifer adhaerens TaxID=106592 RepID=UPI000CF16BEC|nr:DUF1254 domain-containing protein [Ensifer adhaerens]